MELVAEREVVEQSVVDETIDEKKHIANIDFKMVTFSLAGRDYAIDIMKVKEIAKAGRFTFVPNTASFVLGVYNLRGDIIPIIDLRLFFNIEIPERKGNEIENMIIVSIGDQIFGVVVDAIDKVVGIQSSSIQPPHPLFGDINIKYIYGIIENNDRLYLLLDIDKIFGIKNLLHIDDEKKNEEIKSGTADTPEKAVEKRISANERTEKNVKQPKAAPAKPAVPTVDFSLFADSLKSLKKFYVSDVNNDWINENAVVWSKSHNNDSQFVDEAAAGEFLQDFYSPCTSKFWNETYANAVFKALPANTSKQITVWNVGCGKGYETYSLACLLKKKYPDARIRIYGHDSDLLSVSNAPLLNIPAEAAGSWYAPYTTKTVSGSITFTQDIKDMIMFEYHDCIHPTSMPDLDIIFCRDLLSFLVQDAQNSVIADFEEKLKSTGIVILGSNEKLKGNWKAKKIDSITIYGKN